MKLQKEGRQMDRGGKFMVSAGVVVIAIILQGVLAFTERNNTPAKTAVEFSKAYFKLDKTMVEYLCTELTDTEESNVVDDYLYRVAAEARSMGFGVDWMKMAVSHLEIHTEMVDANTAEIRMTGNRRRALNPVFAIVAKIFSLGETYDLEETLTLVKEKDGWKVCGEPFNLMGG